MTTKKQRIIERNNWICNECYKAWKKEQLLKGNHPFQGYAIYGCPNCLEDDIVDGCNIKGCKQVSTCGTPTKKYGYLRLCGRHYIEMSEKEKQRENFKED